MFITRSTVEREWHTARPAAMWRRLAAALVVACAVGLTGWGCESTPDRAADGSADEATASHEGQDEQADADADAEEVDPLEEEFEAFAARVEAAAEAQSQPANQAAEPGDGRRDRGEPERENRTTDASDIDWLETGAVTPDEATTAVPNLEDPIEVPTGEDDEAVVVDEPAEPEQPGDEPSPQSAASRESAAADAGALSAEELVSALADRLAERGSNGLRPWLARAALTIAEPQRELTDADLGTLNSDDRKLVLAYQRMFTQLGRSLGRDAEADRHELQVAAEELMDQLRAERGLSIRKAELCTRVDGYGIYDPFESTTFVAGRQRSAIVYIELDDFQTEHEDGRHVARLRQEIVLYNASDGLAVWRVQPTDIVDKSRNQRRDFFLVQVVKLPATLNVGKYLLKVTITDEVGEAVDESTIPIEFVADDNAR